MDGLDIPLVPSVSNKSREKKSNNTNSFISSLIPEFGITFSWILCGFNVLLFCVENFVIVVRTLFSKCLVHSIVEEGCLVSIDVVACVGHHEQFYPNPEYQFQNDSHDEATFHILQQISSAGPYRSKTFRQEASSNLLQWTSICLSIVAKMMLLLAIIHHRNEQLRVGHIVLCSVFFSLYESSWMMCRDKVKFSNFWFKQFCAGINVIKLKFAHYPKGVLIPAQNCLNQKWAMI